MGDGMVVIDGVRYRPEDAERLGLRAEPVPAEEAPEEEAPAEEAPEEAKAGVAPLNKGRHARNK